MHISIVLIICLSVSLIDALPELQKMHTTPNTNDGPLQVLFQAIRHGDGHTIKEIIANYSVNNLFDDHGATALHMAAIRGKEDMADLLIKSGANVDQTTNNGTTALHVAANNGNERFAKALIKHKADVNCYDQNGVTPLQLAVFENYERVADLLIKNGANPNHVDSDGKSVLHWAAFKGSDKLADILIKSGAKDVSVQDKVGKTPLYYATQTGNAKFVAALKNFLVSGNGVAVCSNVGLLLPLVLYSVIF